MRILHVWDQAGVAFVLAKYQRLQGHDSKAIMVREYDKYGLGRFYKEYVIDVTLKDFFQKSMDEAHSADILHIHSRSDMILKFRKEFGKSKKIVLHYHGTDIRGIKKQKLRRSKLSDLAVRGIFTYRRVRDALLIKKGFIRRLNTWQTQLLFLPRIYCPWLVVLFIFQIRSTQIISRPIRFLRPDLKVHGHWLWIRKLLIYS